MPSLNWKDRSQDQDRVKVAQGAHPSLQSELKLMFGSSARDEFCEELRAIIETGSGELRMNLPSGWTVFWKLRDGESRLLLARPVAEEWVATLALSLDHAQAVLGSLKTGSPTRVSELGAVSSFSNLEVVVEIG